MPKLWQQGFYIRSLIMDILFLFSFLALDSKSIFVTEDSLSFFSCFAEREET